MTWLKAFSLSVLAVVAPAKSLVIASFAMVLFDCVSGILAARKRGERISSAGLRRTLSKGLVYSTAIYAAYVAEHWLLDGLLPVSKLAAGAIGIVELRSIYENLNTVAGGSLFSSLVSKLGSPNDGAK